MSVRTFTRVGLGALAVSTIGAVWWAPPGHAVLGNEERVDVSSAEVAANAFSELDDMSGNGRYVTFSSIANNLVSGDTNARQDLFVIDAPNGGGGRASNRWRISRRWRR